MLIPKGAYLLPALWWLLKNPDVYPRPEVFDPQRFLDRDEPDPNLTAFGFGRRVCPGRHLADSNLYLSIVLTLSAFDIKKAVDEHGNDIPIVIRHEPGFVSHPKPFRFQITPRGPKQEALIRRLEAQNLWNDSEAHLLEGLET